MMDFDAYTDLVARTAADNPDWRTGQVYFNVLAEVAPALAEEVQGTDLDPFYVNARVAPFVLWLKRRMSDL